MLVHHGSQSYDVAVSEAATKARALMEQKIEAGRASAAALWDHVHTSVPADAIVRGRGMKFGSDLQQPGLMVQAGGAPMTVHRYALGQMASKAGIPGQYLAELVGAEDPWKRELAARTLNDFYGRSTSELSTSRHLVRAVRGQVRGFLSDRYRRLDSRPLLEAFADGCKELGAVPVDGTVTDVRIALKAYLPLVFEPVPGEVMCYGVELGNSDYGAGKLALRTFLFRLWCANGCCTEDVMSQVHLGGRLADNVEFSDRTYMLDTRASVSALNDVVRGTLAPTSVETVMNTIRAADEKKVEWRNVSTLLAKKMLKEELKSARDAFDSDDCINLPAAKSVWRVSNAISWIARTVEDPDRRLDLQRLAGSVITGKYEEAQAA
jgi:hypothetical protein